LPKSVQTKRMIYDEGKKRKNKISVQNKPHCSWSEMVKPYETKTFTLQTKTDVHSSVLYCTSRSKYLFTTFYF